ncbi:hypothetical protein E2C01_037810 [Portunus trituberculatus]|uniref:Uncharacterized protein n=1 Tax=Portunus trituberculatus TaxID=210409 RepID=A0A5B7FFK9_PORTR|nr:hypothetical protein [Portunus trituberculatus]
MIVVRDKEFLNIGLPATLTATGSDRSVSAVPSPSRLVTPFTKSSGSSGDLAGSCVSKGEVSLPSGSFLSSASSSSCPSSSPSLSLSIPEEERKYGLEMRSGGVTRDSRTSNDYPLFSPLLKAGRSNKLNCLNRLEGAMK